MPRMAIKKELLAPPLSNRYSLVGTAFDYLMRFYLKRLNPDALTAPWVAEQVLADPYSPLLQDVIIDGGTGQVLSYRETAFTHTAHSIIDQAKDEYSQYLSAGRITGQLIESTLRLAQLDPILRAGIVGEDLGEVHREDVDDLRALISIVEPQSFKAVRLCLLNPTFGETSHLVGGADADLVIDDMIVDIKTTKNPRFQRDYFDQLIGYYILHEIGGVGGLEPRPEISRIAVYFSRQAFLGTLDLRDIISQETFPAFVHWFIERAKEEHAAR